MGEISEMIQDGILCEWCGVYTGGDHGHPVLCQSCYDNASPSEREGHQRAYLDE